MLKLKFLYGRHPLRISLGVFYP